MGIVIASGIIPIAAMTNAHLISPRNGPLEWLLLAAATGLCLAVRERGRGRAARDGRDDRPSGPIRGRMSRRFEELRDWAIDRATDWALDPGGADRLAIDGLSPAWSLRIEAFNLLMPLTAQAAGRDTDFGTVGWRGRLKRRGLDRAARLGALRATSIGPRGAGTIAPVQIAFLPEFATPSGLEPMLAVARALPADGYRAIAPDPRLASVWRRAGGRPVPMLGPWRDELRVHRGAARAIGERWAALRADPPSFVLDGVDLTDRALDRLEPLVVRSVPWLAVERLALAHRLDALAPRRLVLASDQHRLGRQAVELAAERGIRTLVLQHGLPQYRIGFLPVAADAVATWSEASDAWFSRGWYGSGPAGPAGQSASGPPAPGRPGGPAGRRSRDRSAPPIGTCC